MCPRCPIPDIKPALHRSPVFLIGLIPLVALLWAWADSIHTETLWMRGYGTRHSVAILNSPSNLYLRSTRLIKEEPSPFGPAVAPTGLGGVGAVERFTITGARPPLIFPSNEPPWSVLPSKTVEEQHPPYFWLEVTTYKLPYWFLLALYLPLWLGLSLWLVRRKQKRYLASLPSPPPAQPQSD